MLNDEGATLPAGAEAAVHYKESAGFESRYKESHCINDDDVIALKVRPL